MLQKNESPPPPPPPPNTGLKLIFTRNSSSIHLFIAPTVYETPCKTACTDQLNTVIPQKKLQYHKTTAAVICDGEHINAAVFSTTQGASADAHSYVSE